MSDIIHNIQSLMITDLPGMSMVDQINRRFAALATIGRRYGNEGRGVFIKRFNLSDFYEYSGDFNINITQDIFVCGQDYAHPYTTKDSADNIIQGAFISLYEFFKAELSKLGIEQWDLHIIIASNTTISMFCETDTLLPIGLAEPLYISSENIYDGHTGNHYFKSKFTLACYSVGIESTENDRVLLTYATNYWGLGIRENGTLLFNGQDTDIQILGSRGESSQIIMASGNTSVLSMPVPSNISISISGNTYSSNEIAGIYNEGTLMVNYSLQYNRAWQSKTGENVYALIPNDLFIEYLKNSNAVLYSGAALFSFLTITDSDGLDNIYMTILHYIGPDSNSPDFNINEFRKNWIPVQLGFSENNCAVFTFSEFLSSTAIFDTVIDSIEKYIAGTESRKNKWFEFSKIRFGQTGKTIFQTDRTDVSATGNDEGAFTISQIKNPVVAQSNENLPILSINFSDKITNFRKRVMEPDSIISSMSGTLYNDGYDVYNTKLNACMPLLYLGDTGVFCPNVINSQRIYGLGKDCAGEFTNNTDKNQVPFVEHTGNGIYWKMLERTNDNVDEKTIISSSLNPEYNSLFDLQTPIYKLATEASQTILDSNYKSIKYSSIDGFNIYGENGLSIGLSNAESKVCLLPDSYQFNGNIKTVVDDTGMHSKTDEYKLSIYGSTFEFDKLLRLVYNDNTINLTVSNIEVQVFISRYLENNGEITENPEAGKNSWWYSSLTYIGSSDEHPIIVTYNNKPYLIDINYLLTKNLAKVEMSSGKFIRIYIPIINGTPVGAFDNIQATINLNNLPTPDLYPQNNAIQL